MSDVDEYRCFVGSLSWSTTEVGLKDAFGKFGHLTEAKVVLDKFSGRSRGFGFVIFDDKKAMEEAIEAMNGMDLDGRNITVERAQPRSSGRDHNGDSGGDRDRGLLQMWQTEAPLVMVAATEATVMGLIVVVIAILEAAVTGLDHMNVLADLDGVISQVWKLLLNAFE